MNLHTKAWAILRYCLGFMKSGLLLCLEHLAEIPQISQEDGCDADAADAADAADLLHLMQIVERQLQKYSGEFAMA